MIRVKYDNGRNTIVNHYLDEVMSLVQRGANPLQIISGLASLKYASYIVDENEEYVGRDEGLRQIMKLPPDELRDLFIEVCKQTAEWVMNLAHLSDRIASDCGGISFEIHSPCSPTEPDVEPDAELDLDVWGEALQGKDVE